MVKNSYIGHWDNLGNLKMDYVLGKIVSLLNLLDLMVLWFPRREHLVLRGNTSNYLFTCEVL